MCNRLCNVWESVQQGQQDSWPHRGRGISGGIYAASGLYSGARYAGTVFISKSKGGQQRYVHLDCEAMQFFREVCANREPTETMFLRESGEV